MATKYEASVYNDAGQCVEILGLSDDLEHVIKEAEDYASELTDEEIEEEGLEHICVYRMEFAGDTMVECETEHEIRLR